MLTCIKACVYVSTVLNYGTAETPCFDEFQMYMVVFVTVNITIYKENQTIKPIIWSQNRLIPTL